METLYIAVGFVISVGAGVGLAKAALIGFFTVIGKGNSAPTTAK